MDRFLNEQKTGKTLDKANSFTIDRRLSRKKLLESIPRGRSQAVLRLLDAGAKAWDFSPTRSVTRTISNNSNNNEMQVLLNLPKATPEMKAALLDELRRPFGRQSGASLIARAIFRGAQSGATVFLDWGGNPLGSLLRFQGLTLHREQLDVPEDLTLKDQPGLTAYFYPESDVGDFKEHQRSLARMAYNYQSKAEHLHPLESASKRLLGYFDYRCKPFTLIRSYSNAAPESDNRGMLLDLWDGPYTKLDTQTVLLDTQKPGKFLFLRWRPNYGRPTFLHHNLDKELQYGPQECRATFWIETSDQSAEIQFMSGGVVSDPVPFKAPPGMRGIVFWPELKFDIWGTRLVENEALERAKEWTQRRIDQTADTLRENLDEVVSRLENSNLVKKSYVSETVDKIRVLWG